MTAAQRVSIQEMKQKENDGGPLGYCQRSWRPYGEKKKWKEKRFHRLLDHSAFRKAKITIHLISSTPIGHWEQNDISELGHHIWTQPAAQAEAIGQRILGAEFSPRWGEHSHHRCGAENDWKLWSPVHGRWPFFGRHLSRLPIDWWPFSGIMKLTHTALCSTVLVIEFTGSQSVSIGVEIYNLWYHSKFVILCLNKYVQITNFILLSSKQWSRFRVI